MGTGLRNKKKKLRRLGGKGKLTDKFIGQLSIYFSIYFELLCNLAEFKFFGKYEKINLGNTIPQNIDG